MEILIITWNYPPRRGGIEYLVSNLCAGLRQKHSVQVITAHARSGYQFGEYVFRAPLPGLIPFSLYALWRGAILLLRSPGISVIFGGSVMVAPLVLILARLFRRKAVVQAHGLDVIYGSRIYQTLCVRWLQCCNSIVANSEYTASLVERKKVPRERVFVIPPGVRTDALAKPVNLEATKEKFGLKDKPTILFVGRLAKRKGVKEFIEKSLVRIVREIPSVCFVIVGDNPLQSLTQRDDVVGEIHTAVSQLGLHGHVRLLGSLDDEEVTKLYQLCDVVVLPALAFADDVEGFGIVLLEAAAAGRPAVATRVGGIPDAVEDGKSGILVNPGDYERLSQTLVELLSSPTIRSTVGDYARDRVREAFSWNRIVGKYEKVVQF
jgi:phosphatidyl-myo-inositol dimannoside synthase